MFTDITTLLSLVAYVLGRGAAPPFIASTTIYPAGDTYASEADLNNFICKLNTHSFPPLSSVLTSHGAHTWAIYQTYFTL